MTRVFTTALLCLSSLSILAQDNVDVTSPGSRGSSSVSASSAKIGGSQATDPIQEELMDSTSPQKSTFARSYSNPSTPSLISTSSSKLATSTPAKLALGSFEDALAHTLSSKPTVHLTKPEPREEEKASDTQFELELQSPGRARADSGLPAEVEEFLLQVEEKFLAEYQSWAKNMGLVIAQLPIKSEFPYEAPKPKKKRTVDSGADEAASISSTSPKSAKSALSDSPSKEVKEFKTKPKRGLSSPPAVTFKVSSGEQPSSTSSSEIISTSPSIDTSSPSIESADTLSKFDRLLIDYLKYTAAKQKIKIQITESDDAITVSGRHNLTIPKIEALYDPKQPWHFDIQKVWEREACIRALDLTKMKVIDKGDKFEIDVKKGAEICDVSVDIKNLMNNLDMFIPLKFYQQQIEASKDRILKAFFADAEADKKKAKKVMDKLLPKEMKKIEKLLKKQQGKHTGIKGTYMGIKLIIDTNMSRISEKLSWPDVALLEKLPSMKQAQEIGYKYEIDLDVEETTP